MDTSITPVDDRDEHYQSALDDRDDAQEPLADAREVEAAARADYHAAWDTYRAALNGLIDAECDYLSACDCVEVRERDYLCERGDAC